jgi:hypothetical protein
LTQLKKRGYILLLFTSTLACSYILKYYRGEKGKEKKGKERNGWGGRLQPLRSLNHI